MKQDTFRISDSSAKKPVVLKSLKDWEEIFNAMTDMVTIHDKDFNIIYSNTAAKEVLGLPEIEIDKVLKCFSYYHGTECPPTGCPSCDCVKTGKPAVFELYEPHLGKNIEIRAMARFDNNNRIIGVIHICRDITERTKSEQELKNSREKLRNLTGHLNLVREEERKHIAREIHDELAQALTALKIDLFIGTKAGTSR
jgi:signal transduction histidine kinase